jgi:cytochrome oxidase Cu insertion factor (SCO1/SenC/PrrC family)
MKSAALALWITILTAVVIGYGGWWTYQRLSADSLRFPAGAPRTPTTAAEFLAGKKPHFALTERSGKSFDTAELDGKVWVVTFFYTSCPGPCFRQSQALAEAQKELKGRDVRFVSITCDPGVDTPPQLREYAQRFHADPAKWLFLTGEFASIKDIAQKQFLLPLDKQSHSDKAIVIDQQGEIRDVFNTLDREEMKKMTRLLIELDDAAQDESSQMNMARGVAAPQS